MGVDGALTGSGSGGRVVGWRLPRKLGELCRRGVTPAVVLGDLTLVRPLGWAGIPVVAVSTEADEVSFTSRYVSGRCIVPGFLPPHDARTLSVLLGLGAELRALTGRRIPLIYGNDAQLEMLYRHREALSGSYLFLVNDDDLGWAMHDKARFFSLCAEVGVPVPATVVPANQASFAETAAAVEALAPPLLIKPRTKSDWKAIQRALFPSHAKARVFAHAGELLGHPEFAKLRQRMVVQEYIDAPVTALCSFHGFAAADGRLLAWFCGQKLRTYPEVAGESALLELVRDPALEVVGRDVVQRLGIRGPFKIDFIRHPRTGALYTLEVNARFNLWHHLGAAHGVNLPLIAYSYLLDGREPGPEVSDYQPRLRWLNAYRDVQALMADPDRSRVRWLASTVLSPALHEVFAWRDPLPFVTWLSRRVRAHLPGIRHPHPRSPASGRGDTKPRWQPSA
jgi:D-aspartate ligase